MSEYNCDDCNSDCSEVVKALCRQGLTDDCKQLQVALQQANEEIGRLKKLLDLESRIETEIDRVAGENKRLKDFAKYVDDHITDTCNKGFVLANTCPEWLKKRAAEALKDAAEQAKR